MADLITQGFTDAVKGATPSPVPVIPAGTTSVHGSTVNVTPEKPADYFNMQWLKSCYKSPWTWGVAAAVFIFLFLYFLNPPIVQKRNENNDHLTRPGPNVALIATWSLLVGGLIAATPWLCPYLL